MKLNIPIICGAATLGALGLWLPARQYARLDVNSFITQTMEMRDVRKADLPRIAEIMRRHQADKDRSLAVMGSTVVFLTSGTTWAVPSDWGSTNTIECIGGGGNGFNGASAGGGGGGAYALVSNFSAATLGGIGHAVTVGIGAAVGDTYFNASSLANAVTNGNTVSCAADHGRTGASVSAGAGGLASNSVGTTKNNGGTGGVGVSGVSNGGGGGAGGPFGAGGTGGAGNATLQIEGGGGGGGGGSNGEAGQATRGGNGGNNHSSAGGGAGGTSGNNGAAGTVGGGGGGGNVIVAATHGGVGGPGTDWDSTHGSGGGGGGDTSNATASTGGLYGGGGGGREGAAGAQGIIVITYTPGTSSGLLLRRLRMLVRT